MADDLGFGDVGVYGQKKIKTPVLDRMAREGVRFAEAYAGSTVCAPSRSALMTGQHTGRTWIRGNAKQNLRPEDVTLAEVMKSAGYATALFGKWGLGHEGSTGVPTKQGFDQFFGYLDQTHAHNSWPTFLVRNEARVKLRNEVPDEGPVGQGVATKRVEFSQDLIWNEALSWIEARGRAREPFFVYLAPTLPHANNENKTSGLEIPSPGIYAKQPWTENQKNHAAMITRLDADVGRVLALLRKLRIDKDTLVLFTSDNGPHREGGNDPEFADSNGPLRGIKRALYEGGIRVPAVARWPGRIRAGSVSKHPWANWDVMATLAEVAGATSGLPAGLDSLSFAPVLMGKQAPVHDVFYWEFHEATAPARAVRMGSFKLIEFGGRGGRVELFDLANDLAEEKDLAVAQPERVAAMRKVMDAQRADNPHWPLAVAAAPSPR
jgi:arylsulfatase A-like enzyme